MKSRVLIGVVFIIGCATGGVASQLAIPPIRAGTAPARWEYLCTQASPTVGSLTAHLNQLGAQGWDLVSTSPAHLERELRGDATTDSFVFCFRRAM